jgi:hypothetical protein
VKSFHDRLERIEAAEKERHKLTFDEAVALARADATAMNEADVDAGVIMNEMRAKYGPAGDVGALRAILLPLKEAHARARRLKPGATV